jgi:hypothetical protein
VAAVAAATTDDLAFCFIRELLLLKDNGKARRLTN